jgi:hypothetical protein
MRVKIQGLSKVKRKPKYRAKVHTVCFRYCSKEDKHKDYDEVRMDKRGCEQIILRLRWKQKRRCLYVA